MSLDRCPKCRELIFSGRHKCPPKWWIYCTDENVDNLGMEEPRPAFGHYPDRALEKWVGQFECDTAGEWGIATDSEEPMFAIFSDQDYLAAIDETEPWDDRKSTRLNSSHLVISYAVFCLKKKKFAILNLFIEK